MTVWKLDLPITGSISVEIHADTEEEARALLADGEYEPGTDLCIQCSGYTTHLNKYPVRFSLDIDQVDELEFKQFTRED